MEVALKGIGLSMEIALKGIGSSTIPIPIPMVLISHVACGLANEAVSQTHTWKSTNVQYQFGLRMQCCQGHVHEQHSVSTSVVSIRPQ